MASVADHQTAAVAWPPPAVVSYAEWLRRHGADAAPAGPWAHVGAPDGDFGWKIHLSSTQAQALSLLERVVPVLLEQRVPFKAAVDSDVLAGLNEGVFGPTQVGKFITIYPQAADGGRQLVERLVGLTRDYAGPAIVTDLHVGSVVYVRYGTHDPAMHRDRLGNLSAVDEGGRGGYQVPFVAPEGVENPYREFEQPTGGGPATDGRRKHAAIGPGYVLLQALSVHPKGSVFLALDAREQDAVRSVVLKEGRRHCMSDAYGRDIGDRLRHQARIHREVADHVRVPRVIGDLFELGGNLYLPLEYVEGQDLTVRDPVPFASLRPEARLRLVERFRGLVAALSPLHARGYVHRDLSPRNVRVTETGSVYLLDLEIAHRVGDNSMPPFQQGTIGFVSPQQRAGAAPAITDDLYSVGCIVVYAITGLDPRRIDLASVDTLRDRLGVLSGAPAALLEICARCLDPEPAGRPSINEIDAALRAVQVRLDEPAAPAAPAGARETRLSRAAGEAAHDGAEWILRGSPRDEPSGLWPSPELAAGDHEASLQSPHAFRLYRSVSRGVGGVVYAIARARRFGIDVEGAADDVGRAVDWLLSHAPTADDQMPGLCFGEAGVAVAIAESVRAGLIERGPWLDPYLHQALSGPLDWPDLSHGAAGQGLAALLCADVLGDPALAEHAQRCTDYLLRTQAADGDWPLPEGVPDLEGVTYTGFAHGVAGIVYFLAAYARVRGDEPSRTAALRGAGWLVSHMHRGRSGAATWPMRTNEEETWHWWCNGGPGIALAFLELHGLTGDPAFADVARSALYAHPLDVRHTNLSQCHGLAGYGEALLTGYETLGTPELLDRARHVGDTLVALRRREPRGVSWLVENPYRPTADMMIGCGGVTHFLARLSHQAHEPLGMPFALP